MNDVAVKTSGTGLMNRDALAKALNRAATTIPVKGGDYQYMKVDKNDGAWLYGQEDSEVADDLFAVNPGSFQWGYIAWPDEKSKQVEPHGEVMVPINRDMPDRDSLAPVPDGRGWEEQRSVEMVGVIGPSKGIKGLYKQSSVGAMKFFADLTNAVLDRVQAGEDAIVPIVKLWADPYQHKKYGRIFNPKFTITEWRTMDDAAPPVTAAATAAAAEPGADADEEDAALEAEYKREEAAKTVATEQPVPRRRQRQR